MRILVLDHYFGQDIDALLHGAPEHEVRVLPVGPLVVLAYDSFPPTVSASLAEYHKPEYTLARERWRRRVTAIMIAMYTEFPCEVFIVPSDTFFYIRDAIAWLQQRGVPCIVVQKETTISPLLMQSHADEVKNTFPFIGDCMTVCSERHKEFWVKAGTDPECIIVTGQPRFDLYTQTARWLPLTCLGVPSKQDAKRTILFLSYDIYAYTLNDSFMGPRRQDHDNQTEALSWALLRAQTEQALLDLVTSGQFRLLIKPHPQQPVEELDKLISSVEPRFREDVLLLPGSADVRHCIVNADVVVGFQTTALYEAIAVGKRVIYTFWGNAVEIMKDYLIPFHEYPESILHRAVSPDHLKELVKMAPAAEEDEEEARLRKEICEEHLGSLDGQAAQRVMRVITDVVSQAKQKRLAARVTTSPRPSYLSWGRKHARRLKPLFTTKVWQILLITANLTKRQRLIWRFHKVMATKARRHLLEIECERELFRSVLDG